MGFGRHIRSFFDNVNWNVLGAVLRRRISEAGRRFDQRAIDREVLVAQQSQPSCLATAQHTPPLSEETHT
jgi:hypothetical protein